MIHSRGASFWGGLLVEFCIRVLVRIFRLDQPVESDPEIRVIRLGL
jgi:hypothetical protein